jgi:HlyD family secretion protein
MGRVTKVAVFGGLVVVAGVGILAARRGDSAPPPSVVVAKGDLVDRALAVGTIEPETQVEVKSKVSGVVRHAYANEGDFVRAGAPLLDIRPDPTPVELVEARRQLELQENDLKAVAAEQQRGQALFGQKLFSQSELDDVERRYRDAQLQVAMAREKLSLLETGKASESGPAAENELRSPISGYVLKRMVEVGDPVVPLSSYQAGTVLFTMADMNHLIFKGTVDEIDVGRLREGMPADIKIGALPDVHVHGTLSRIALKADTSQSATVFPVQITITDGGGARLRAGYSANAEIVIAERHGVLTIPERVVSFSGDSSFVDVPGPDGGRVRRLIQTGLSDALNIEVRAGLKEGDRVLEKPVKSVE